MPTYPYECGQCGNKFAVIKRIAQRNEPEHCEKCNATGTRYIARVNFNAAGEWNSKEYQTFNPALGTFCANKGQKRDELLRMRDRGQEVEEIGNEPLDSIHRWHDNKREEIRNDRWRED